jgi:hypothetical protein
LNLALHLLPVSFDTIPVHDFLLCGNPVLKTRESGKSSRQARMGKFGRVGVLASTIAAGRRWSYRHR